jgi:hypothetical protein
MSKQKKLISRITSSEHAYLRRLHDAGLIDFANIDTIINEIVVDRFNLARQLLGHAKSMATGSEILARRTITTSYYSQYHACRAVVLFHDKIDRGDDHEKLPGIMERILPGRGLEVALKGMLSRRRCAEYDPYLDFDPIVEAGTALAETEHLLASLELFLRSVGVQI